MSVEEKILQEKGLKRMILTEYEVLKYVHQAIRDNSDIVKNFLKTRKDIINKIRGDVMRITRGHINQDFASELVERSSATVSIKSVLDY